MNNLIAHPNPTTQGGTLTICIEGDFSDPVVVTLAWVPTGLAPATVTLTPADPCETIRVPDAAESLLLSANGDLLGVGIKPA